MLLADRERLVRQICPWVLFGFTLDALLSTPADRDLHVLELWSGVQSIVNAARACGLEAEPFDKAISLDQDILTSHGFGAAVNLVMRLSINGLLWMAPVCSSWGFMNAANCQRGSHNALAGNIDYEPVAQGNMMAKMCAFLFALAWARGVEVAVENPACSSLFKFPPVEGILDSIVACAQISTCVVPRCAYDSKPPGLRPLKRYRFVATGAWILQTSRPCTCPGGKHLQLTTTSTGRDGRCKVSGKSEELKQSGAYPPSLGQAVVSAWSSSSGFPESSSASSFSGFPVSISPGNDDAHQPSRNWKMQDEASEEEATGPLVAQKSGKKRRASWAACRSAAGCSRSSLVGQAALSPRSSSSGFPKSSSASSSSGFPVSSAPGGDDVRQPRRSWKMQDEASGAKDIRPLMTQRTGKKRRASWAACCSSSEDEPTETTRRG